jgi:biotin carboxyl carrier protein
MKLEMEIGGQTRQVEVEPAGIDGKWMIRIDGEEVEADAHLVRPGVLSLLIGGKSHRIVLDDSLSDPALHLDAQRIAWEAGDPRSLKQRRRHARADGPVTLKASMPGRVVRVLAERGDSVAAHQAILVIEAMKMQNEVKSPKEGRVADLRVAPGDTVASGEVLAVIE